MSMSMVLAQCKKCGKRQYVPTFKLGGDACDECLRKTGKSPTRPNRGLLKKRRARKPIEAQPMTDHREQAIRDVAEVFLRSTSYISDCLVKPLTCDDEGIAYAVSQRERVLELEAFLRRVKGAGGGAMSFEHDDEDIVTILGHEAGELLPAKLQQKEDERG